MFCGSAMLWLALAPARTVPPESNIERTYTGPTTVEAPEDADPVVRSRSGEAAPRPDAASKAGAAPTSAPETFVSGVDVPPSTGKPTGAPVPRILTVFEGWYPGEFAKLRIKGRYVTFTPGLQVRTRVGSVSEFTLDELGNTYDTGAFVSGRVRWNPVLGLGRGEPLRIVAMVDIANGRWSPPPSGDAVLEEIIDQGHPPVRTDIRIVDPRELYIQWRTRYGQLLLGQMAFNWGLGLLANNGNNMDRFGDMRFGNDGDGSIQERILFATKPLARTGGPGKDVIFGLGADLIFRDPNANLLDGDLAGQGVFLVRWQPEDRPGTWLGSYAVYRRQKNADDGDTIEGDDLLEVGVFDFAGQGFKYLRPRLALVGAFETVAIVGRTTFLRNEFEQHDVLQAGAAVRGYIGLPRTWLVGFDGGWASGDANPDDDEVNAFEAAPGHTAGLLLFPYYIGWQTARSEILARDPSLAGEPPNGTQFIPTEGSVTNTVYLHPKARWAVWEKFEVWGGPLLATSAVPVVDPYTTALAGGEPTNSLGGRSDRRYLGTELDLGVRGRYGFEGLWVQAGFQAAVFFPGPALADASGDRDPPVWGGWFRAEVRY